MYVLSIIHPILYIFVSFFLFTYNTYFPSYRHAPPGFLLLHSPPFGGDLYSIIQSIQLFSHRVLRLDLLHLRILQLFARSKSHFQLVDCA